MPDDLSDLLEEFEKQLSSHDLIKKMDDIERRWAEEMKGVEKRIRDRLLANPPPIVDIADPVEVDIPTAIIHQVNWRPLSLTMKAAMVLVGGVAISPIVVALLPFVLVHHVWEAKAYVRDRRRIEKALPPAYVVTLPDYIPESRQSFPVVCQRCRHREDQHWSYYGGLSGCDGTHITDVCECENYVPP